MISTKEKEQTYKTVPEGTYYYGLTLIDGDVYRVFMWNDLFSIEGTDRIVTMTFRLFDVTIKGSGLLQIIRDAKRHRIDILTVTGGAIAGIRLGFPAAEFQRQLVAVAGE